MNVHGVTIPWDRNENSTAMDFTIEKNRLATIMMFVCPATVVYFQTWTVWSLSDGVLSGSVTSIIVE